MVPAVGAWLRRHRNNRTSRVREKAIAKAGGAQEFIDGGDRVVVIGRLVARGKGSGIEIDQPDHQILTVREGRIVRLAYGYTDRAEVLKAAGLRE
jgi:ketosteroid isomerase-like protein